MACVRLPLAEFDIVTCCNSLMQQSIGVSRLQLGLQVHVTQLVLHLRLLALRLSKNFPVQDNVSMRCELADSGTQVGAQAHAE